MKAHLASHIAYYTDDPRATCCPLPSGSSPFVRVEKESQVERPVGLEPKWPRVCRPLRTSTLVLTQVSAQAVEPLLGTSEPSGTLYDWNPYLEPRNLPEPLLGTFGTFGTLLGTLTWNLGTCRNLYVEPLYLEPRNLRNLTWNPYLEPRNLPEPLLGTLTRNLGTCRNLYLEARRNLYLEPLLVLVERRSKRG